ncbi:hypothetical protein PROFUN_06044 [Planoprotostelium fungivorum]|uniref:Glycosyltransferase family 32 protein n=1 Tax=Planoprotostelium fungivorum TaxID=1890364 RepID=A0A2P6NPP6_9EUKA|nr:hypothetical protein PROFUN_06044 [Planoprotostelium fungivorum]
MFQRRNAKSTSRGWFRYRYVAILFALLLIYYLQLRYLTTSNRPEEQKEPSRGKANPGNLQERPVYDDNHAGHKQPAPVLPPQDATPPILNKPIEDVVQSPTVVATPSSKDEKEKEEATNEAKIMSAKDLMALDPDKDVIPRIVHQSWKDSNPPSKFALWSKTWRVQNPGWVWVLWTDADNEQLCKRFFPWFYDTFQGFSGNIYRADLARHMYMYRYGGVYADLDSENVRPLDILYEDMQKNPEKWTFPNESSPIHKGTKIAMVGAMGDNFHWEHSVPNAWMASIDREHPFWLMSLIHAKANKGSWGMPEHVTGPSVLWSNWLKYRKLYGQDDSKAVWDEVDKDESVRTSVKGDRQSKHSLALLNYFVVFPYHWNLEEKNPVKKACSLKSSEFDTKVCKERLDLEKMGSFSLTYWTHSWTPNAHDGNVIDKLNH